MRLVERRLSLVVDKIELLEIFNNLVIVRDFKIGSVEILNNLVIPCINWKDFPLMIVTMIIVDV